MGSIINNRKCLRTSTCSCISAQYSLSSSAICLSSSAMDIKELKFLDIKNTVNKLSSGQGAATESSITPSGCGGQSNSVTHLHVTSSSSQSSTAPVTILRRGRHMSDQCYNHLTVYSLWQIIQCILLTLEGNFSYSQCRCIHTNGFFLSVEIQGAFACVTANHPKFHRLYKCSKIIKQIDVSFL